MLKKKLKKLMLGACSVALVGAMSVVAPATADAFGPPGQGILYKTEVTVSGTEFKVGEPVKFEIKVDNSGTPPRTWNDGESWTWYLPSGFDFTHANGLSKVVSGGNGLTEVRFSINDNGSGASESYARSLTATMNAAPTPGARFNHRVTIWGYAKTPGVHTYSSGTNTQPKNDNTLTIVDEAPFPNAGVALSDETPDGKVPFSATTLAMHSDAYGKDNAFEAKFSLNSCNVENLSVVANKIDGEKYTFNENLLNFECKDGKTEVTVPWAPVYNVVSSFTVNGDWNKTADNGIIEKIGFDFVPSPISIFESALNYSFGSASGISLDIVKWDGRSSEVPVKNSDGIDRTDYALKTAADDYAVTNNGELSLNVDADSLENAAKAEVGEKVKVNYIFMNRGSDVSDVLVTDTTVQGPEVENLGCDFSTYGGGKHATVTDVLIPKGAVIKCEAEVTLNEANQVHENYVSLFVKKYRSDSGEMIDANQTNPSEYLLTDSDPFYLTALPVVVVPEVPSFNVSDSCGVAPELVLPDVKGISYIANYNENRTEVEVIASPHLGYVFPMDARFIWDLKIPETKVCEDTPIKPNVPADTSEKKPADTNVKDKKQDSPSEPKLAHTGGEAEWAIPGALALIALGGIVAGIASRRGK